ncbi:rRNA (cytosine-C5-)-methyltransferase nop2 [Imshaugia aleurites]|uniref:Nucleolar protein 2 n=1 Tax=Imshaugia aleurites TaxID=172621 RepID=A0A8H3PDC0_9LECA|nr:rRNA (cytosine-C5-)-methyltransferase nop2 [Imshaugia aleurites]
MGVGRRMKKQGPPPPLDESRVSALKKRKAGVIDDSARGKKRKASGEIKVPTPANPAYNHTTNSGLKHVTKGKFANGFGNAHKGRKGGQGVRMADAVMSGALQDESESESESQNDDAAGFLGGGKEEVSTDDDAADLLGGGEEAMSTDDDAADLLGRGEEEDAGLLGGEEEGTSEDDGLGDEFLGSGSSVYDSDPQHEKARFSEDENESDAEEKLTAANIVGLSRRLDEEQEEDAAEAQLELEEAALQTNIDGDRLNVLDDEDENTGPASRIAPDLQLLRSRITDTIRILDDFSKLSEPGRSRAEYTAQFIKDVCLYYGYSSYLAEKLFNLFTPREAFAFFEANESPRPVVIRTNTIRTHRRELAQSLINRGVTLEPVGKWSKVGLQVFESQVPLGATPEYLAGQYIIMAASSFLPVMALAPQEHERILDMAAAPGGKTTYIAALMKNTGSIFANDTNKGRTKALIGNIHRLGVKNTVVCNYDAREFPRVIGGFDRVLLDAPCSGTGVIAKDPSVKTNKTEKDFMQLPHLQKQLLLCAIDSVDHTSKTGGYIVYSTCSVSIEENEQVVQYALKKRPNVKLVETGLTFGIDGFVSYMGKEFDPKMKTTKRFYPHAYNVDGFFVSKFKKTGPSPNMSTKEGTADGARNGESLSTADRTPIATDNEDEEQPFGGFDDSEDERYMEKARRNRLRRKGIDPKTVNGKEKANDHAKSLEKEGSTNGTAVKGSSSKVATTGLNGLKPSKAKASANAGPRVKAPTVGAE